MRDRTLIGIRDQLAMAALTGLLASEHVTHEAAVIAKRVALAYEYADAMMAEREEES